MNGLKKVFAASGFAATIFAAGSALAQDNPPAMAFEDPATAPDILWSDEGTLVLAEDMSGLANSYNLMCPGYGSMREFYSTDPNVAVMLVRYEDRATLTQHLIHAYENAARMLAEGQDDMPSPLSDSGMIAVNGTVLSTPRNRDEIDLREEFLDKPGEMPGADITKPENVQKLRRYADNYCRARY